MSRLPELSDPGAAPSRNLGATEFPTAQMELQRVIGARFHALGLRHDLRTRRRLPHTSDGRLRIGLRDDIIACIAAIS